MTLEEFHERFDDEDIVKHFKEKYPGHITGLVKNFGMIFPTWGYTGIDSPNVKLTASLLLYDDFGKYGFAYVCDRSDKTWTYLYIKNPTKEDIDNNLCW